MALVVTIGAAAAVFQIDAEIITQVSTPVTGIWFPVPTTGEIVQVDVGSGEVTARVLVGDPGADLEIAEHENGLVVVDRTTGRVVLVDPALHRIIREAQTFPGVDLVDIGPKSIVVAKGDRVAIVDLDVTGRVDVGIAGPVRSIAASGLGAVAEDGERRVDVAETGEISGDTRSVGVLVRVVDQVAVVAGDEVKDLSGKHLGCLESPLAGIDQVVGSGQRWIVVIDGSTVHVTDLDNGECAVVDLGADAGPLGRPVVAGRRVFVPGRTTGQVHIIEPARGVVESHEVFSAGDLRLRSSDSFVVAYDAGRSVAALLDIDGVVSFVDTVGNGIQAILDEGGSAAVIGDDDSTGGVVDGADGVSSASNGPIIDAGVLATTLRNPLTDDEDLPDDRLIANFAFSATTVVVGESVRFIDGSTGSPTGWIWDFGDGTGDEGPEVQKSWDVAGSYPVTLRVSRGEETAEISLAITVVPAEAPLPPAADFAFSATVVDVGDVLQFEDRSDGDISRWRWDFGDGTTATVPNVDKSWSEPGRYVVRLTVANEQGTDDATVTVEVVAGLRAPIAVITVAETDVDLGAPVSFKAGSSTDPARYVWDFGDGRASTVPDAVHVFLAEGTFTVRLTAQNDAGSSVAVIEIRVNPPTLPPTAVIATLPTVIEVGEIVTLTSLSTNSPDTEEWSFDDGDSASGEQVTHVWASEGTYLLTLTATNAAGTNFTTVLIEVVAVLPAPLARIGVFNPSPWVGEAVVFSDASIDAVTWLWDFGDGVTSNAADPLHTFTAAGQKIVTLTVSNRAGTDSVSVLVAPRLEPIAAFFVSSTATQVGKNVAFIDDSVNAVSWRWRFGDGTTSTAQNPRHAYTTSGVFSVNLKIENATGDIDTFGPVVINVDPASPLLAGITKLPVDTGTITTLATATFEAIIDPVSGPIDTFRIDFGDGSALESGPAAQFSHVFAASGTYDVLMQARGPLGEWSDWVTRSFTVADPPAPLVEITRSVPATALVGDVVLTGEALPRSGPIDTWRWVVSRAGNEWNYTGRVVTHTFEGAGTYTLTLIAEGPVTDDTVIRTIEITVPPAPAIVSLVANPSPATTGFVVEFRPVVTGSVATWEWDFEGGGSDYIVLGGIGSHIFNTAGVHEVFLRITGPFGGQDVMSVPLTVNPLPSPSVPVAAPAGTVITGTSVNLTSVDGSGLSGLRWDWTVNDGSPAYLDVGASIDHVFATAGSWTVTVTATSAGGSGTAVLFVTVVDPAPPLEAGFSWLPAGPLQIQFTDTSSGPPRDSWSWDFGSPAAVGVASDPNPLVIYPAPGSYTVTLTVGSGSESAVTVPVVVVVP